jgi:hypothetical protein
MTGESSEQSVEERLADLENAVNLMANIYEMEVTELRERIEELEVESGPGSVFDEIDLDIEKLNAEEVADELEESDGFPLSRGETNMGEVPSPEELREEIDGDEFDFEPLYDDRVDELLEEELDRLDGPSVDDGVDDEMSGEVVGAVAGFIHEYRFENVEWPELEAFHVDGPLSEDETRDVVENLMDRGVLVEENKVNRDGEESFVYRLPESKNSAGGR